MLLQLPKAGASSVSHSPFTSLAELSGIMRLVPPETLRHTAEGLDYSFISERIVILPSGKQFALSCYQR